MHTVRYKDTIIGYATHDGGVLVGSLVALADDHPRRRFAVAMLRFGNAVAAGEIHGPYDDELAQAFARTVLMPDPRFDAFRGEPDATLASRFNVPVDQVARKRADLDGGRARPHSRAGAKL